MNESIKTKIEDYVFSLDIDNVDIPYYIKYNKVENIDIDDPYESIFKMIEDGGGFSVDIIGYGQANEYLMKHDTNLRESHSLAKDMGFDLNNIDIETLASVLASQNATNDFYKLKDEIEGFFDDIRNEYEDNE